MLNAHRWDELPDSEPPVFLSTSKLQSFYELPFLLFAIVSALHSDARVPGACASRAAHVCKQLDLTLPFL